MATPVEDIVQARIEMANVTGAMIAQEIVELGERARNVLVTLAVNKFNPLSGVRVVKPQTAILAFLTAARILRAIA